MRIEVLIDQCGNHSAVERSEPRRSAPTTTTKVKFESPTASISNHFPLCRMLGNGYEGRFLRVQQTALYRDEGLAQSSKTD